MTDSSYQRTPDTARIEWLCVLCGAPVADGEGALRLPGAEMRRLRDEEPTSGGTLRDALSLADEPAWRASHDQCEWSSPGEPDGMDDYYWIDVEGIRDDLSVIRWTAHLMEKAWLSQTNWHRVLRAIGWRG